MWTQRRAHVAVADTPPEDDHKTLQALPTPRPSWDGGLWLEIYKEIQLNRKREDDYGGSEWKEHT
jgi:hypothetical protein